jgi:hypothetical protein
MQYPDQGRRQAGVQGVDWLAVEPGKEAGQPVTQGRLGQPRLAVEPGDKPVAPRAAVSHDDGISGFGQKAAYPELLQMSQV